MQENKSIYLSIYLSIWKPFWKRVYIYIYIYIKQICCRKWSHDNSTGSHFPCLSCPWCLLCYTLPCTENVLVEKRQEGSSGIKVLNEKLQLNNGPPTLSKKAKRYCLPGLQLRVWELFHPRCFQRFIYYIKIRHAGSAVSYPSNHCQGLDFGWFVVPHKVVFSCGFDEGQFLDHS